MGNRVRGRPLELEVVTKLLADDALDDLEDVGEDAEAGGVLLVVVATLEHTGADQAGVPAVHVATDDVGLRVVADHVDVLGETLLLVQVLHPLAEDLVGVGVCGALGLAVDDTLEVEAGAGLELCLQGNTESTEVETRGAAVVGGAEEITLREVDGDVLGGVLGTGQETAVVGEQEIDDDLVVGHLVVGLGEDQDGVELDVGKVLGLGLAGIFLSEAAAGGDCGVPGQDILGEDDVLEAVLLSDLTNLKANTTAHEDGVVVLGESLHGGVGLDKVVR